nr:ribonuclease H-like domain-containing protein [Tanacetum cinerariifolium]
SGPAWLFDIDSLSQTMNYHPVNAENQTNTHADALVDGKEHDDDIQKSVSPDIHSSSCGDQTKEQCDKAKNKDKGKSHVVTITGFRDLNEEFAERINNSSNEVNAAGSSVSAVGLNFTNSTNDFSAAGPSNAAMPNLEDLSHNADDVGAEADINNIESIISFSHIPTTRIHKDHPTSQIISDLSSTTLTRSMARGFRDQGGISQMFNKDFHTCMFACFLSQEEPKRVHQALKDPSWIESMQEELLRFKMQKVWILVDLPYGKRAIELKFNLFSVSQMCDKKNSVLFTDIECLVLSSDFKLPDASQVLLRVPKENNMYNVNLKNIIPSGDLTCLFVKATLNESNLWHRRLSHVNFKTINKLVKGNLVRGLPSKDETPPVLKTFIIGLENLLSLKVKIIRCDNGTEFKNADLNKFCRVLVTKPHNKTPYEPLHGRLPSIGFMRPFGCPVTILNTLDPLGKFQGKVDERFLVGYSTMNYHPVIAENQTNSNAGFPDTEKAGEEGTQTYVLFPVLFDGSINSQNNNNDALVNEKEHDDDTQKSVSPNIHSSSSGAQTRKQECNNNSSNGVNVASSLISTAGQNSINSTNDFSAVGPSNAAMPNLEDLSHSNDADDVGAATDINNMESIISVSLIPTTRIYKDHPTSQIIGDLSLTTQTKSMARAVRDQGGIS